MVVLVTCKNKEDPLKIEGVSVVTTFLQLEVYGFFFRNSRAANSAVCFQIWPKFELCRGFMIILVTCKNEEDPIKDEGTRVATRLNVNFSEVQGQITP